MPALIAWTVVFVLGAYAVCGVPFGLYIARALGHVDVRQTGSGNIGTTNVARSVGKKAAALTLLCDLGKGLVWMLFSRFMLSLIVFGQAGFAPELGYATQPGIAMSVIYLGCVFGHVFSPYLDFMEARASPSASARRSGCGGPWPWGCSLFSSPSPCPRAT